MKLRKKLGEGMKRQKNFWKKYWIIAICLVTVMLGITAFSIHHGRSLTWIEKGVKDTVLTIGHVLSAPLQYGQDKWEAMQNGEKVLNDYEKLQKEVDSLNLYKDKLEELELENEELRELLDLNASLLEYDEVSAMIINRNITYWLDSFTIDKGEREGIQKNMAVLGKGQVIGYISQTSLHTSTVKLFTSSILENQVSVKIDLSEGKYAYGLLTGYDSKEQVYKIEGISGYVDIPISAKVTTTGLGDRFPSGLVIGTVSDVQTDNFDLSKVVSVRPSGDASDIRFVTVLIRGGGE